MNKTWRKYAADTALAHNFSPLISQVLSNRGIKTLEEAQAFLNPKLAHLRDPFEIAGVIEGARRVLLAKERGEKVVVFGDYDVDGITGTAIMVNTLKLLGIDATYYIPHRYGEGYGLSLESVKKIAETGAKLIITVDCGIASAIEVEEANALGMDVIVTDHHNLPSRLPNALAVVNPKQIKEEHPSKYLSGAGVAFKFAWGLLRTAGLKDSIFLTALLDLVSLGTFSDVVPLTQENRILAAQGLNYINDKKRLGIKLLMEEAGIKGKVSAEQIYFGLAPRLNAAGRLEHASRAVDLLLSEDENKAREMARELGRINSRRQDIGSAIKEEVFAALTDAYVREHKMVVLSGNGWHPGVIGIVASQVADRFGRPAVLIGVNEGVGRGSARGVDGISIYGILNACRDLFLDFGGHEGAAGFEINADNIPELARRVKEEADQRIRAEDLVSVIEIDAEIVPEQITLNMVKELDKLAPFGEGNPTPVFMSCGLKIVEMRKVGPDGRHFKAKMTDGNVNLEIIAFRKGDFADKLSYNDTYDIAYELSANEWNGFETVQLGLVDIKPSN